MTTEAFWTISDSDLQRIVDAAVRASDRKAADIAPRGTSKPVTRSTGSHASAAVTVFRGRMRFAFPTPDASSNWCHRRGNRRAAFPPSTGLPSAIDRPGQPYGMPSSGTAYSPAPIGRMGHLVGRDNRAWRGMPLAGSCCATALIGCGCVRS